MSANCQEFARAFIRKIAGATTSVTVCMLLQTGIFALLPHFLNCLLFYCYVVFRPASTLLILPEYKSFALCFSITLIGGLPLFDLILQTRRGFDFETMVWTYWHSSYKTKLEKKSIRRYLSESSSRFFAVSVYTIFIVAIFVILMFVVGLMNQALFLIASIPIRYFEGWMNGGGYDDTSCNYGVELRFQTLAAVFQRMSRVLDVFHIERNYESLLQDLGEKWSSLNATVLGSNITMEAVWQTPLVQELWCGRALTEPRLNHEKISWTSYASGAFVVIGFLSFSWSQIFLYYLKVSTHRYLSS